MNEGKSKLEEMRKMLKKRGDSNGTNDKPIKQLHNSTFLSQENSQYETKEKQRIQNEDSQPNNQNNQEMRIEIANKSKIDDPISIEKENIEEKFDKQRNTVEQVIRQEGEIEEDEEEKQTEKHKDKSNVELVVQDSSALDKLANQNHSLESIEENQLQHNNNHSNHECQLDKKDSEDSLIDNFPNKVDSIPNQAQTSGQSIQKLSTVNPNPPENLQQNHEPTQRFVDINANELQSCPHSNIENQETIINKKVSHEIGILEGNEAQSLNKNAPQVDPSPKNLQSQPNSSLPAENSQNRAVRFPTNTLNQGLNPSTKVVLKELKMIKSSIHDLNVTYRGLEYLRESIKQDSLLKKRIKERLQEYSEDKTYEVLRKMVKKINFAESIQQNNLPHLQKNLISTQAGRESETNKIKEKTSNENGIMHSKDLIET